MMLDYGEQLVNFSELIESASSRVEALMQRAGESPLQEREALPQAFEELSVFLEELRVANEELSAQNAELVTARKHIEEERQRYLDLFEFAPDGYIVTYTDGTIREANRAALKMLNASRQTTIGKALLVFVPEAERRTFRSHLIRLQDTDQTEEWEVRLQPRHGGPFPAAIKVSALRDLDGKPTGLRWIVRDITERKRAEESRRASDFLAEASRLLGASLDYETTVARVARLAVPSFADLCIIYIRNGEGGIERFEVAHAEPEKEKRVAELERRFALDLNSKHPVARVLTTGKRRFTPEVSEELLAEMSRQSEQLNQLKELDIRSLICLPLRTHGRMLGVISFMMADSGRRFTPADLALAEDLARRAAVAVDNARLYQEAQSTSRVNNQSLSITLHEIKTPLTVVLNASQLMRRHLDQKVALLGDGEADGQSQITVDRAFMGRNLQHIEQATQRLVSHINELVDITQIQSRSLVIVPEHVDLSEIVCEVIENIRMQQQAGRYPRNIELQSLITPEQVVFGNYDRGRMEQVLFNLVENAIKYSPRGGTVRVSLAVEDRMGAESKGPHAHLAVSDQGIGVPPADQQRIFQPFVRGSNAAARNFSGIGVGLAICKEIVDRHGGRIWVESPGTNQGSTLHVLLPITE